MQIACVNGLLFALLLLEKSEAQTKQNEDFYGIAQSDFVKVCSGISLAGNDVDTKGGTGVLRNLLLDTNSNLFPKLQHRSKPIVAVLPQNTLPTESCLAWQRLDWART